MACAAVLGNERIPVGSSCGRVPAGEVEREAEDPQDEARDSPELGRVQLDRADREHHWIPLLGAGSVYTQTSVPMMTSTARIGTNWTSDI